MKMYKADLWNVSIESIECSKVTDKTVTYNSTTIFKYSDNQFISESWTECQGWLIEKLNRKAGHYKTEALYYQEKAKKAKSLTNF